MGDGTQAVFAPALLLVVGLLLMPLLVVFRSLLSPDLALWQHLLATVLPDYLQNSLLLAAGVGLGALLLGASLAWLIVFFRFPGRNLLQWLLLLPMAMPAYIIAYSYTGLLDFAGPLQSLLRDSFGWRYGYLAAGIGMTLSVVIQLLFAQKYLGDLGKVPGRISSRSASGTPTTSAASAS